MFRSIIIVGLLVAIFSIAALMMSEMVHMSNEWITNVEREALK